MKRYRGRIIVTITPEQRSTEQHSPVRYYICTDEAEGDKTRIRSGYNVNQSMAEQCRFAQPRPVPPGCGLSVDFTD